MEQTLSQLIYMILKQQFPFCTIISMKPFDMSDYMLFKGSNFSIRYNRNDDGSKEQFEVELCQNGERLGCSYETEREAHSFIYQCLYELSTCKEYTQLTGNASSIITKFNNLKISDELSIPLEHVYQFITMCNYSRFVPIFKIKTLLTLGDFIIGFIAHNPRSNKYNAVIVQDAILTINDVMCKFPHILNTYIKPDFNAIEQNHVILFADNNLLYEHHHIPETIRKALNVQDGCEAWYIDNQDNFVSLPFIENHNANKFIIGKFLDQTISFNNNFAEYIVTMVDGSSLKFVSDAIPLRITVR